MHVALVHRDLHELTRGGICTIYRALAPRLRRAGCRVTLITQDSAHPVEIPGVRLVSLARTDDLHAHRRAVDIALAGVHPDLIESSSWEAETLNYARRPTRAPVVVRGDLSAATMRAHHGLIAAERELMRLAEVTLAVSTFAAIDLATTYHISEPIIIRNGVDTSRFCPGPVEAPSSGDQITVAPDGSVTTKRPLASTSDLPPPWGQPRDGRLRLAWVGKTTPMKGWDRIQHLAVDLADLAHTTILLGHAPALSEPVLTGAESGITLVRDLNDSDMADFYRAADAVISTSRWEGFGLSIAEALACGTPVLIPVGLGTGPELLAVGGGRTYRTTEDLRALLTGSLPSVPTALPADFDWDHNATATLRIYRRLIWDSVGTR